MGHSVSVPVTSKRTNLWQNENYFVGASCMQGWRLHMEDAHTCFLEIPGDPAAAYFSVFDGHGGNRVAKHAGRYLHERIVSQPEYAKNNIKEAVRRAFLLLDAEMESNMTSYSATQHSSNDMNHFCTIDNELASTTTNPPAMQPVCEASDTQHLQPSSRHANPRDELAGSTGIIVLIKDHTLYCGNAGDSRAVCCRLGVADSLSTDHKPTLREEKERILAAGGWIDANRVNGNLALSRAFGDFVFKRNPGKPPENQIVSANPDVHVRAISREEDEFVLLGCDGVWDVMTNQEVVSFVRLRLSRGISPDKICEELMMRCLAPNCHTNGLGCDNMTVVLICFLNGQPLSELQCRCSRPCKAGPAVDILGT